MEKNKVCLNINQNIFVLQADKRNKPIIIEKSESENKMNSLVNDTYKEENVNLTSKIENIKF